MTEFARRQQPESTLVAPASPARTRLDRLVDAEGDAPPVGNQAMLRWLAARGVQPKLEVSQPGDAVEREADDAAAAVLRMPEPAAPAADTPLAPPQLSRLPDDEPALHRQSDEAEEERKKAKGTEKDAAKVKAEAAEKEAKALDEKSKAKKKEEEDAKRTVMPKAAAGERARAPDDLEARLAGRRGRGRPLSSDERAFFEPRFGRDLGGVRLHTDAEAARTAREVRAQAFTTGRDIYFGAGRYQPGTTDGRLLLAHELAHTLQQAPAAPAAPAAPVRLSALGSRLSAEAPAVAESGGPRAESAPRGPAHALHAARPAVARQEAAAPDAAAPDAPAPDTAAEAAPVAPNEVVSIEGTGAFEPSPAMTAWIGAAGAAGADVRVRLGALAEGTIKVRHDTGAFQTVPPSGSRSPYLSIPLTHPALQPLRDAGVEPVVALRIQENVVDGYASIATSGGAAPNPTALTDWIREHATEMGWLGFDVTRFPQPVNELKDGVLRLQVTDFDFRLGGFLDGQADFGLENEAVTFEADAAVHVQGLTDAQLQVRRDESGQLAGRVEVPVSLASFSGNVIAEYGNGTVAIEGTVRYDTEKLSGEITLLVTDAATARDVALRRLGPDAVEQSAETAEGEPAAGEGPVPGPRALAGWGMLDFRLTEWFTGQAQVIVDNEGHITIVGEIAPPAEVELFPQRDWVYDLFTVEIRTLYGVPLVGNVFLFANIGLAALAKLGPAKIYDIRIEGTYSTDPRVFNQFSMQATLNISAFAGLRLRGEGGVGVELLGHDIKTGVGVNALAGIRGYVEATPTIGYRETADPAEGRVGEFFLHGHLELAAQPFLALGGDLFVELDSPWWSPAPDEKWTWPLGELEYPLPGEFGIGADVDYVLGSPELPEISFGEVDFNADRFMTDLMNDHVPPARGVDEERQGEWAEVPAGTAAGEAPAVADSQGAPAADQPAQGAGGAAPPESAEQAALPPQQPSPELVKAAALADAQERLGRGDLRSIEELQAAVRAIYDEHRALGLRSLAVDIPDESTLDIVVSAAASDPEQRTITWAEAFAPGDVGRAIFAEQPRYETHAAVSINGVMFGEVVASDRRGHAEQNLLDRYWDQVIEQIRANSEQGTHSTVVLAINRAPCHTICTWELYGALNDVPDELKPHATFILAPTGVYEATHNMTEEELAAASESYRQVQEELRAAGHEVEDYTIESVATLTEHTTRMSDLDALAEAGWDVRQLQVRAEQTSAGRVLAEAAHKVAVRAGRVQAGP